MTFIPDGALASTPTLQCPAACNLPPPRANRADTITIPTPTIVHPPFYLNPLATHQPPIPHNNGNGDATDDGIACEDGCTLTDNTARSNDGYGIRINGGGTSYRGNTLSNNSQGTVVGGTDVGGNLCNGSTTCP